jgi:hypothetical protein
MTLLKLLPIIALYSPFALLILSVLAMASRTSALPPDENWKN